MIGENNINSKLTNNQVINIRKKYINNELTIIKIQKDYNLSRRTVENLLLGRSYEYLPFNIKKLNHKIKLDKNDAINIRKLYKSKKFTQNKLAEQFNVSRSTIRDVVTYRTFKNN